MVPQTLTWQLLKLTQNNVYFVFIIGNIIGYNSMKTVVKKTGFV